MRILSLFDGMACGYIAMQNAGVEIESYDAYEIDKYAIQTATHNFPQIVEHGDVFNADFTQYAGVDFLIGGSPCTHWSIAQTQNRETTVSRDEKGQILLHSSGIGFELFSQYLRALDEAKPKYFIYENNKSMSKEIRAAITECFGFEPVCINSALVSAQNRQRLYWVGIRNAEGEYSKVHVEQPEDRGILLKDVLDSAVAMDLTGNDKSYVLTASYDGACAWNTIERSQRTMVAEPIQVGAVGNMYGKGQNGQLFSLESKTKTLSSGQGNAGRGIGSNNAPKVILPVGVRQVGRRVGEDGHRHDYDETIEHEQRFEVNEDPQKTNCISTVAKDSMVAEPIDVFDSETVKSAAQKIVDKKGYLPEMWNPYNCQEIKAKSPTLSTGSMVTSSCATIVSEPVCVAERGGMYCGQPQHYEARDDGKTNTLTSVEKDNRVAEPIQVGAMPRPNGELSTSQAFRVYDSGAKSVTINAGGGGAGGKTGLYAIPYAIEFDSDGKPIKAIGKDGKQITIYEVRDGKITIKGKQYPIKLVDGYYIIRKLTVSECKRLQTVPEWYEFPVSDSQAYKMLGNGWTCDVITHLIQSVLSEVLS